MPNNSRHGSGSYHAKKSAHAYLKIFLLVILTVGFAVSAYAFRLYSQAKTAVNATYRPVDNKEVSTNIKNGKPLSILLLGVDTGAEGRIDKGNSDTMILATVNKDKEKVNLVSIPRDTMAKMQYKNSSKFNIQKINAAYNLGSSSMAISTVEKLVNVPIDYYVTIDMSALSKIVDAVGGIDVDVPFSFNYDWQNFKKGKMHLNGKQALAYSRMRYEDPDNDYGRQKRQQQVIKGIINSAMSLNTLTNFEKIMNTLSDSVATNLSFDDMLSVYENYKKASKNIKSDHIQGRNAWIDGASYQVAPTSELQRISNKLRKSLELDAEKLSNEETKQNKLNPNFFANEESENYTVFTPAQQASLTGSSDSTSSYGSSSDYGSDTFSSVGNP
ncbi:LCP family protein [Agrilactobacillus yilanensis]|uniref:LCP family protein n=1 Tax=Agrilactobacillus yilanensis TaxID=2485997 RepID=A0ABW4J9X9_9LACO|nr:LCP family protein [Agrilactobacillus yilanensis]